MRVSISIAMIALAGHAALAGEEPPQDEPPSLEFVEFLGETAGVDPEIVRFMVTREAQRAIKKAPARPDDAPPAAVGWDSLDAASQSLLDEQKQSWNALPAERQRILADGADRWIVMSDTERAAADARFQTWRQSPGETRDQLRELWKRFRELSLEQEQALRAAYRRFLELPPERREAMIDRWQSMSPEERRRAIQRRQGPKPGSVDPRPCPPC